MTYLESKALTEAIAGLKKLDGDLFAQDPKQAFGIVAEAIFLLSNRPQPQADSEVARLQGEVETPILAALNDEIEPTDAMLVAGEQAWKDWDEYGIGMSGPWAVWKAMQAAAPERFDLNASDAEVEAFCRAYWSNDWETWPDWLRIRKRERIRATFFAARQTKVQL